jgi:hypothetical protein
MPPASVFTALPAVGQVVAQGDALYSVDGAAVVLLFGATPAWRTLASGDTGPDVAQLNADLVALGDATSQQLNPASDVFGGATAAAVKKLQAGLGTAQTGSLTLGQVVFLPTSARITAVTATLGATAQPDGPVLSATSTSRAVVATLEASQLSQVHVGQPAMITLPGGQTTPGVVTAVGTVATAAPDNGPSNGPTGTSSGPPTVAVDVTPSDPAVTGTIDQAPVAVDITTATARSALAVPVTALLAGPDGRPEVDVVSAGGLVHPVEVSLGIVDDTGGLVQLRGAGLAPGALVALPR